MRRINRLEGGLRRKGVCVAATREKWWFPAMPRRLWVSTGGCAHHVVNCTVRSGSQAHVFLSLLLPNDLNYRHFTRMSHFP